LSTAAAQGSRAGVRLPDTSYMGLHGPTNAAALGVDGTLVASTPDFT
jgi:multisubunit Na+/H+ antiporter MnhG subunit